MNWCLKKPELPNVFIYIFCFTFQLSNLFFISLAVADLLLSALVMPFAIVNDLTGEWKFGKDYCNLWISTDVTTNRSIITSVTLLIRKYIFGTTTTTTTTIMGCLIYILDSSNSSSITFWTSQFNYSSRSNWTGIWTGNSNGGWTDKQSSHFGTAKEMSVKATLFFM